ncbi:MAG: hypothetical protein WKF41_15185, partial [Gaiellaceae bacterium]
QQAAQRQVSERPEQEGTPPGQRDGTPTPRGNQDLQTQNRVNGPHRLNQQGPAAEDLRMLTSSLLMIEAFILSGVGGASALLVREVRNSR